LPVFAPLPPPAAPVVPPEAVVSPLVDAVTPLDVVVPEPTIVGEPEVEPLPAPEPAPLSPLAPSTFDDWPPQATADSNRIVDHRIFSMNHLANGVFHGPHGICADPPTFADEQYLRPVEVRQAS